MKKLLTDRKILKTIHDKYYDEFTQFTINGTDNRRESKIYVPIDCVALAKKLAVDPDIIFGRLYYHLDRKYGYTKDDRTKVQLFTVAVGNDHQAINFPLLSAVLSDMQRDFRLNTISITISIVAIVLSLVSIFT